MKRGFVRADGLVFVQRLGKYETWVTPERLDQIREREHARYMENRHKRDQVKARGCALRYWKKNREKILLKKRTAPKRPLEKIRISSRKSYQKHRQKNLLRGRIYYQNNKLEIAKKRKAYLAINKHKSQEYKARRRSFERSGSVELTATDKFEMAFLYALSKAISSATGVRHHVDHEIPITRGGIHHPSNMRLIDATRNQVKSNKIYEKFKVHSRVYDCPAPQAYRL